MSLVEDLVFDLSLSKFKTLSDQGPDQQIQAGLLVSCIKDKTKSIKNGGRFENEDDCARPISPLGQNAFEFFARSYH